MSCPDVSRFVVGGPSGPTLCAQITAQRSAKSHSPVGRDLEFTLGRNEERRA
ncbi:DUF6053 domain-containing protein [Lysobacter capsici]|uniref:DUF6053 domain-containing protein n=1 Tax=Lysobacter capsici TaxID=435897 RepID=UPI001C9DD0F2